MAEDNVLGPLYAKKSPGRSGYPRLVTITVPGANAQTAALFSAPFFIADAPYEVTEVIERHEQAGTDAGAVTLMVKKVPDGTAPAAGDDVLGSGLDLKATADTNQAGTLTTTLADKKLVAGDSLSLVPTGVLTNLLGVSVRVTLRRI